MTEKNAKSATLRYFGSQMRMWRQRAGITRERLAAEVGYSVETISSVEQGRRMPQPSLIEAVDDLLHADGLLKAGAVFLSRDRYPAYAADFMEYEADAVSMYWYESQFVPGLLQTENHARALLRSHCPPLNDDVIAERVEARMQRQAVLTERTGMVLSFVLEETALRRPVGGRAALREQLLHLLAVSELRHVSVQVLPTDRGAHAGMNGPMVLLETSGCQRLAYVEGQLNSVLVAHPEEVSLLSRKYGILRSLALDTEQSARYIKQLAAGE